jgi:hypothetical protein
MCRSTWRKEKNIYPFHIMISHNCEHICKCCTTFFVIDGEIEITKTWYNISETLKITIDCCSSIYIICFESRRCAGPHEEKKRISTFYIVLSLINLDLITIFSTLFKKKLFNKYYHCSSFPNRYHWPNWYYRHVYNRRMTF